MNPICFPIAIVVVGAVVLAMALFTATFGISDDFYTLSAPEGSGGVQDKG